MAVPNTDLPDHDKLPAIEFVDRLRFQIPVAGFKFQELETWNPQPFLL
jgi:hypothetical protein